jgi:hypothetical protein
LAQIPACRSCRHCSSGRGRQPGWCRLRQLAIHPDLAGDVSCHHWTPRSPRLPTIPGTSTVEASLQGLHRQLDLHAALAEA